MGMRVSVWDCAYRKAFGEKHEVLELKLSENSRISVNCGIYRRTNQNAEQTMQ